MARDIRNERTERAILDAFLDELSEKPLASITVSAVAKRAGISRSTFYAHFSNVRDVFDRALGDFVRNIRELNVQLRCASCGDDGLDAEAKLPFCVALRRAGRYDALVRSPEFLPAYLGLVDSSEGNAVLESLVDAGVQPETARNVMRFQLSGCYAVALSTPPDADWRALQRALDDYIRGGIAALRSSARAQGR